MARIPNLNFTPSRDGVDRADVRLTVRLCKGQIATLMQIAEMRGLTNFRDAIGWYIPESDIKDLEELQDSQD